MNDQISKSQSYLFKGIAITYMLLHHLVFSGQAFEIGNFGILVDDKIQAILFTYFRICVPTFAFLTGWGYAIKKDVSIKKCFKTIGLFLLNYNLVYFVFLLYCIAVGGYRPHIIQIIYEMFGLKRDIMIYCWYVPFYCVTILLIPLYVKNLGKKGIIFDLILGMIIPILFFKLLEYISIKNAILFDLFNHLMHFLPCVTIGMMVNRWINTEDDKLKSYTVIKTAIRKIGSICSRKPIVSFLVINSGLMVARVHITALDFIYGPIFVFSLLILFSSSYNKNVKFYKLLEEYGKLSSNIWFLQCGVFSLGINNFFQKTLYLLHNPFYTSIVSIILFGIMGFVLTKLDKILISFASFLCKDICKLHWRL